MFTRKFAYKFYLYTAPIMVSLCGGLGMLVGGMGGEKEYMFQGIIIGNCIGLTYPVSFPIIISYMMYNEIKVGKELKEIETRQRKNEEIEFNKNLEIDK